MTLVQNRTQILEAFQCQGTGNCCIAPGYVYVNHNDIDNMASILNVSKKTFMDYFVITKNGYYLIASPTYRTYCFLSENNQCQVYQARPLACQTYPNWDVIWATDETLLKEAASCKGLSEAISSFKS